jgi:hypothetical protein
LALRLACGRGRQSQLLQCSEALISHLGLTHLPGINLAERTAEQHQLPHGQQANHGVGNHRGEDA